MAFHSCSVFAFQCCFTRLRQMDVCTVRLNSPLIAYALMHALFYARLAARVTLFMYHQPLLCTQFIKMQVASLVNFTSSLLGSISKANPGQVSFHIICYSNGTRLLMNRDPNCGFLTDLRRLTAQNGLIYKSF